MVNRRIVAFVISVVVCLSTIFSIEVTAATVTVSVPNNFSTYDEISKVNISWTKLSSASGYKIYRSTNGKSYSGLTTIRKNSTIKFTDTNVGSGKVYYYYIKAFKKQNGKTYFSKRSKIMKNLIGINFYTSTYPTSVKMKWQRVNSAKGYEIFYSKNSSSYKRLVRLKSNKQNSYTFSNINTSDNTYKFYVKCYKMVDDERNYFYTSSNESSKSFDSILNGQTGPSKASLNVYNVQGDKVYVDWKMTITNSDKKIFSDYANKYFTADMSPSDKIKSVFNFIHSEVTYATGSNCTIVDNCSSYVDAVFNKNLGQCAQYNGAMAEYLAYMGINIKLLMGYRGTSNSNKWQHFWGQAEINGVKYVVETGNEGQDGSWSYYFKPYSETKKYLKCGKYISGIKA